MFPVNTLLSWHSLKLVAAWALVIPLLIIRTLGWKGIALLIFATIVVSVFSRLRRSIP